MALYYASRGLFTSSKGSEVAESDAQVSEQKKPPRRRSARRLLVLILVAVCLPSFSVAPLWRLLWRWPVYSAGNRLAVRDTRGVKRPAWRWIEGRAIRVYVLPHLRETDAIAAAEDMRSLLQDAGLDLSVEARAMPPELLEAWRASLREKTLDGRRVTHVSFRALESRLCELRDGDPHADVFVVDVPVEECEWAQGMASFRSGLCFLQRANLNRHLARHEVCHLVGYMQHDNFPIFVLGYPWEGWPWQRNTLMMLLGTEDRLSPRARDALHAFWRGMENRTGRKFIAE